ncbi:MAG: trypsin-like serine protease [Deltaproteobacteria bacterium]|nr:trypsin-like serine protease [Deltaproteobacteria bacterium]MBI4794888.1 trypsin-like serine protease [Deltaproteobacteria bacterium]
MKRTLPLILLLLAALGFLMPGAALASSINLQGTTLRQALTTYGDPADYVVTSPSSYDGVAKLRVSFPSATYGGSAALLWNNQYLLTAAHMVVQGTTGNFTFPISFSATLSGGAVTLSGVQYFVHPGWTGNVNDGNDLAVVRLASPAPISGYQIYRDPNTIGVVANLAGYGRSGNGDVGNVLPWGTLRQGQNRYDAFWDMPGFPYAFDFDDGTLARDTFGNLFGLYNLGTEYREVDLAPGDSGGPGFFNGQIAGVHSFIATYGQPWDLDNQLNSSFGEVAGDMRVAAYAGWIDSVVVPIPGSLVLLGSGLAGLLIWGRWRRSN